jgi:hypothetical protein
MSSFLFQKLDSRRQAILARNPLVSLTLSLSVLIFEPNSGMPPDIAFRTESVVVL